MRQVSFGWAGVSRAAIPASSLWVTPNGSVIEAQVWPPIARRTTIATRGVALAWRDVVSGRLPLVVANAPGRPHGVGVLGGYVAVSLLSRSRDRRLYLVPAYQFGGFATFRRTPSRHAWLSFSPAAAP